MWPDFIVKANILIHTFTEVLFRCIFSPIGFFLLKCCEKRFCNSIVIRAGSCGKGLFDPKLLQQFKKCIRNVLSTSVTMKSQIFRISAFGISVPKSCCHKPCTGGAGYRSSPNDNGIASQP